MVPTPLHHPVLMVVIPGLEGAEEGRLEAIGGGKKEEGEEEEGEAEASQGGAANGGCHGCSRRTRQQGWESMGGWVRSACALSAVVPCLSRCERWAACTGTELTG